MLSQEVVETSGLTLCCLSPNELAFFPSPLWLNLAENAHLGVMSQSVEYMEDDSPKASLQPRREAQSREKRLLFQYLPNVRQTYDILSWPSPLMR